MEATHFEALYPANAREKTLSCLLQYIKEGNSCQLIGLPGSGRANIFGLLAYNRKARIKHLGENQKWFHFVTVDFSEVRNKPLFEATKLLFLELVESLHERRLDEEYSVVTKLFKEALSFRDELVLFQGLKKAIDFLAIEKELTIVFLLERFEEYLPSLTKDFFSNLRILRNRAKYRFSVVFSLGRPLEELVDPFMLSDFYEFLIGHIIYVPLQDPPLADFRLQYLEKISGKAVSEKDKKEIFNLSSGHGKLTRLCYEALLGSSVLPTPSFFLSKKPILGALYEIWNYLSPKEQQEVRENVFSHKKLNGEFLSNVELIQNNNLSIPLFVEFVKEYKDSLFQDEKIVFDDTTNTIKKGEITLSDILTASEFRMLVLLIQHKDEVVGRDSIIDAVWKEGASTAGVTDQAVDQLVFRLRKKIEEDPNNPQHILTVKGRGVKFQQ